ncbi:zinc knuckle, partial [Ostertagia ostertagi]
MATTLSTRQGLLTKALNRLNSALEANKDWAQAILQPPSDEHERRIYMRTERAQIRTVKAILEAETLSVDDALGRYSSAADSLAADTPSLEDILRKVNSNVETAVAVLDYGHTMLTALKRRLEELDEMETHTSFSEAPQTNLAPIPIPKFSGRIWEWDTFWGAFQHSVDSREIDDLYKMNYLLDALQGEAKETVKQFEVSGRTYPLVVAHLKEKYGNTQALVDHMIRRLQKARAQSERLEHQEKLLEELSSIVSQLQLKGENVDNCFLQDQLLGKFTEGIQRHVLRTKEQRSPNDNWDTNMLLSCAKEYIRTELKIVTRVGKRREQQPVQEPAGDRRYPRTGRKIASASERQHSCFYCGKGDHAAKDCTEVATREERMSFMRKRNLCLNCGSAEHWAGQCKGGACRICNNHGHHTSLCQQLPSATKKPSAAHESKKPHQTSNRATPKRPVQKSLNSSKMNTVVSEPQPSDEVPTTAAFVNLQRSIADVHILVGQAHVLNPKDQALEAIHVLLDTGADRSFICTELADRLQLRDISSTKLTINTFGSKQPLQQTCGITQVQMWDSYGKSHRITVTKIGTVTEPILRRSLSEEDRRFLRDNNICLSIHADIMELKPQVLLGCADLYAFLEGGFANQKTLPSGLTLIPSKLGYLVSGYETPPETHPVEQPHSDAGVKTSTTGSIEDEQDWEQFCTFESTGFLKQPSYWSKECRMFALPVEQSCSVTTVTRSSSELLDWTRHNHLPSVKRTLAYVLRFIHRLSLKVNAELRKRLEASIPELRRMSSDAYITAEENEMAQRVLIRHHQTTCFTEEQLKALKQLSVVLISDPALPRNSWKLGRIISIPSSNSEKIREVQLKLPSGHIVRRPVNLLVPLELEDSENEPPPFVTEPETPGEPESAPRYELRPRKRVNYNETTTHCSTVQSSTMVNAPAKVLLACVTALMLATNVASAAKVVGHMSCIPGGVAITTNDVERYELCVEGNCHVKDNPHGKETIHFPPEVLLHEHHVQLKLFKGQSLSLLEASCSPASFCENIRCWICTANIFNPECSPRAAITAIAFIIYIGIAVVYVLCFVPVVIGKPCRLFGRGMCNFIKFTARVVWLLCRKLLFHRRQLARRYDVQEFLNTPLLAVISVITFSSLTLSCQDIDVFFYHDSICTFAPSGRLIRVQPTVPINYNKMRITLTSLSFPPTPMLASSFISDGSRMALWNHKEIPHFLCDSEEQARLLNCTVTTNCKCEPAENKVTCVCTDFYFTSVFSKEIENRFPIRRPWITFATAKDDASAVVAWIPSFTTTELLIHLKEEFDNTIKMVTDSICTVPNSIAKGCYHCPQGATAEVTCTTNGNATMATVVCEEQSFTIPCQGTGSTSTLRFTHSSARVMKNCTVSCGTAETTFEITGVLQWVRTIYGSATKVINSESNVYDELIFPDFGHIFDVILHWYKTVIIVLIILALALILGYILLWSCGCTIIGLIGRMMLKVAWGFVFIILLPKKTPSTTAETNTTATAPSVPGATPQSKPRVPPKRPTPAAKPAATAGKGRASGTMLKELLQQGSRILRLAACKVDQLAPAVTVTSSEESMQYLKRFEQLLQTHHVRSETAQKSIEAKIDTLMLKVDTITNRLDRVEQMMKGTATASALKEQSSVEQTRWRELQIEIQGLQAKVDALNLPQLQRDMDELKASLKELNSQNVVDVDSQPNAAREPSSEMERVLRQMGETERELKEKPEEVVILAAPGETRTHAEDRRNDAVRQDRRTTSTDGPSEMPRTT